MCLMLNQIRFAKTLWEKQRSWNNKFEIMKSKWKNIKVKPIQNLKIDIKTPNLKLSKGSKVKIDIIANDYLEWNITIAFKI